MKLFVTKGATDQTIYLFIQDSSSTTGAGLTGLVYNAAGLACHYVRPGAVATAISLATQTVTGAHSDGGFVEVSSANMPGWYRLDLPDAVAASGVDSVGLQLKGATNMAPCNLEIQLVAVNLQDATRAGMAALPNAAAEAPGGLYTRGTGPGQINQDGNGRIDANAVRWGGTAVASATVRATLEQILGTAVTEGAAGRIAAAFQTFFNVASPVATTASVNQTGDSFARLGAPAGASVSADIAEILAESATLAEVAAATSKASSFAWELQRALPAIRHIGLESFGSGSILTAPTIASGDWKISKGGGAFANLATLPDVNPGGSNQVRIQLSESELDAEWIVILGIDQTATKEWRDVLITIKVTGSTVKVAADAGNAAGTFKITRFGLGTEATDMLKSAYLKVLTGALAGQVQKVTGYNSTTDFVTVSPDFTGIPADGVYMQVVNG